MKPSQRSTPKTNPLRWRQLQEAEGPEPAEAETQLKEVKVEAGGDAETASKVKAKPQGVGPDTHQCHQKAVATGITFMVIKLFTA